VVGHGPLESYGFHALEALQCLVERRRGGEKGLAAVQCLSGAAVWEAAAAGAWDWSLLEAALAASGETPAGHPREIVPEPAVFLMEYRDGLRAAVCMLNGVARHFAFAARIGHFAYLLEKVQELVYTGRPPYPVERTLLTTGVLDRAMESRWRGGVRLETPELAVRYQVQA